MISEKEILNLLQQQQDQKRYEHTLRVVKTAEELAIRFGAPVAKVRLAAYLHDLAKCLPLTELSSILEKNGLDCYLNYSSKVWHAPAGAILSKIRYNITDIEVLGAVRYHATGRPDMGLVEEIVFLADYIEPARRQPGVEQIRELSKKSLKIAIRHTLANTVEYLESGDKTRIHPDTLAANKYYSRLES